jgi:hypothetical protein
LKTIDVNFIWVPEIYSLTMSPDYNHGK